MSLHFALNQSSGRSDKRFPPFQRTHFSMFSSLFRASACSRWTRLSVMETEPRFPQISLLHFRTEVRDRRKPRLKSRDFTSLPCACFSYSPRLLVVFYPVLEAASIVVSSRISLSLSLSLQLDLSSPPLPFSLLSLPPPALLSLVNLPFLLYPLPVCLKNRFMSQQQNKQEPP